MCFIAFIVHHISFKSFIFLLDIYTLSCYYNNRKGVIQMSKQKRAMKKPTKNPVDWRQTFIGALVDLIVGTLLLLIAKLIEK